MYEEAEPGYPQTEAVRRNARPVVLPEPYAMAGPLRECSSRYGWDDAAKLLWRRIRLTGRAHTTLKRLPEATKVSNEATAAALTQRFEPTSNREVCRVEFQSRTKVQGR